MDRKRLHEKSRYRRCLPGKSLQGKGAYGKDVCGKGWTVILAFLVMSLFLWKAEPIRVLAAENSDRSSGTDGVKIRLELLRESGATPQEEPPLLPGALLWKTVRIINEGCTCRLRAKVTFQTETGEGTEVLAGMQVWGMESDWDLGEDGYYYCKTVLSRGESVELFHGIRLPVDLPQEEWETRQIQIVICAEASQADSFVPESDASLILGLGTSLGSTASQATGEGIQPGSAASQATGDRTQPEWYAVLAVLSLLAALLLLAWERCARTEEKGEAE